MSSAGPHSRFTLIGLLLFIVEFRFPFAYSPREFLSDGERVSIPPQLEYANTCVRWIVYRSSCPSRFTRLNAPIALRVVVA